MNCNCLGCWAKDLPQADVRVLRIANGFENIIASCRVVRAGALSARMFEPGLMEGHLLNLPTNGALASARHITRNSTDVERKRSSKNISSTCAI